MSSKLLRELEELGELEPFGYHKEIQDLTAELERSHRRHADILKKGTTDPFWPDGVNANIVRNHILYFKGRIRELCKLRKEKIPTIAKKATPKAVRATFMAPGSRAAKHYPKRKAS